MSNCFSLIISSAHIFFFFVVEIDFFRTSNLRYPYFVIDFNSFDHHFDFALFSNSKEEDYMKGILLLYTDK